MAGRFSVEAVFKAIDKVTAPVTRMQNRVGKFTRGMQRGFFKLNRVVGKFAGGLKKAAMGAAVALALASTAMAGVVGTGAQFEQAITNVGAVSLQTRDQIRPLEQMALQLGKTTKFTATQAANAMEVLARAGFDTNAILKATPAILAGAAASGLEIAEVADHVSNALKGMGLETTEAARVVDVLALASSKTNSTIGSLGESLRNVASTARQLNIPFEEVVASVALLQDVGLDASVAGSAFNTMLTKMAAPTDSMKKKMKKFGVSFKDAEGNMLPLQKVLANLSIAAKKSGGNFDKVAFLAELVGLRGQKAAANLGDLFETGELDKLITQLLKAEDAAQKMADIRMNTVLGSFDLLKSAIDGVFIATTSLSEGPLKTAIDRMTAWVAANEEVIATGLGEFLADIFDNMEGIVKTLGSLAKGVAAVIALSVALKAVSVVIGIINLLMMANPIVLAIMAAVAAVALLSGALDPVVDFLKEIGSGIAKAFDAGSKLSAIFSGGDDEEDGAQGGAARPQVVAPEERLARRIEESRTTSSAELTIRDDTGRAELTKGQLGNGLTLAPTGAFE